MVYMFGLCLVYAWIRSMIGKDLYFLSSQYISFVSDRTIFIGVEKVWVRRSGAPVKQ